MPSEVWLDGFAVGVFFTACVFIAGIGSYWVARTESRESSKPAKSASAEPSATGERKGK